MAARAQAHITPSIIRWGLQRANASRVALADKLNVQEEKIALWEKGEGFPTMRQAKLLAGALDIPFGYLFLSEPPEEPIPISDFRTIAGKPVETVSLALFDVIYDVVKKQEWYHDFLVEEGTDTLDFVGSFTTASEIAQVAVDIRETVKVNDVLGAGISTTEEFISSLIRNSEDIGILVMRSGVVRGNTHRPIEVEECRGFAISDPIAPVVFINGSDAKAAQVFTLAHELAHIWIGASGISAVDMMRPERHFATEAFCDAVAAEVLVPAAEFLEMWNVRRAVGDNVSALVRHYRVSSLVVLRRAYDLRKLGRKEFFERFQDEYRRARAKEEGSGGGNYYLNVPSWNSKTLTATIVGAAMDGRVLFREAARLLNVKVPVLHELAKRA